MEKVECSFYQENSYINLTDISDQITSDKKDKIFQSLIEVVCEEPSWLQRFSSMTSSETILESHSFVTQLYLSVTQFLYIRKICFHFLLAILSVFTVLFIYSNYIYLHLIFYVYLNIHISVYLYLLPNKPTSYIYSVLWRLKQHTAWKLSSWLYLTKKSLKTSYFILDSFPKYLVPVVRNYID